MENQYLSLLKVYKVQILFRSLHIINFLLPFSNKNAKYNFALMVTFCIFQKSSSQLFIHMEFYILFVSKYCVIKMHFLDHPVIFISKTDKDVHFGNVKIK